MSETCEVCQRPKCRAVDTACAWDGRECHGGADCYSRGYEREKARANREHAERFQLEKERGEMNEALKAEMARADHLAEVRLKLDAELVAARGALAAARRDTERLNAIATKALAVVAELHHALATALAAPADGEEGT